MSVGCARWKQHKGVRSSCTHGLLESSSAESPRHQWKAEQNFHSCSQAGNTFWKAQWPDLHRQNGGNSSQEMAPHLSGAIGAQTRRELTAGGTGDPVLPWI